jgi:TolA-binding protein
MNISRYELSIGLLDRIRADYPDFSKIPDCLFLKAFIYENMTNELKKAEDAYKEFISKYPEDELVSSAKAAIEHLGIPTEDLIKSFEEKNKSAKDSIKA